MFRLICVVAAAVLLLSAPSPVSAQDKRVALLIGNSDYSHAKALKNPVNDVADLGSALSRIGFSVSTLSNAGAETMKSALDAFRQRAMDADVALIFFAGHAVEADGLHWSIPVDGKVDSLGAIKDQSVNIDRLLAGGAGSKLTILLIDTARDNPFAKEDKPAAKPKGQSKGPSQGQPKAQAKSEPKAQSEPQNLLVLYSTSTGRRPLDGEGRNSPFAAALLKYVETPGLELGQLARNVRDDVATETKRQQIPAYYGSMTNTDTFLVPR